MTQTSPGNRALKYQPRTSDQSAPEDLEPRTLEIGDYTLNLVDEIDGLQLMLFTAVMGPGYSSPQRAQAMTEFLQKALTPADYPKFVKACQEYAIEIEELGSICSILADSFSERPTMSAQPSSAGRKRTGSGSKASSSSRASRGASSARATSSR